MFERKRTLVEHEPSELDLELLSILQGALMAKLVRVNRELIARYSRLAELGENVPDTEQGRAVLIGGAERLATLNTVLESELERKA
jgi:hypothetical protein